MSDTGLKATLARRITTILARVEEIHEQRTKAQAYLDNSTGWLGNAARDLAEINTAMAQLFETPLALLPPDVTAVAGDGLGLSIGGLLLAPPENATADQYRQFAGLMRALYDPATHLARAANDRADALDPEGAHIRGQALAVTGTLPSYIDPGTGEIDPAALADVLRDSLTAEPGAEPDTDRGSGYGPGYGVDPGPAVGVDDRYVLRLIPSKQLPPALQYEAGRMERGPLTAAYTVTAREGDPVLAWLVRYDAEPAFLIWGDPARSRTIHGNDDAARAAALGCVDLMAPAALPHPGDSGQHKTVTDGEKADA